MSIEEFNTHTHQDTHAVLVPCKDDYVICKENHTYVHIAQRKTEPCWVKLITKVANEKTKKKRRQIAACISIRIVKLMNLQLSNLASLPEWEIVNQCRTHLWRTGYCHHSKAIWSVTKPAHQIQGSIASQRVPASTLSHKPTYEIGQN